MSLPKSGYTGIGKTHHFYEMTCHPLGGNQRHLWRGFKFWY